MLLKRAFILSFQFGFVFLYTHEKPVAQKLWPEPCTKGQRILNDCNWCVCKNQKFTCAARVCSDVDMFGHFNDQIHTQILGMEGHGAWRTFGVICEPKSYYQRDGLLCICTENGRWPNAVCRAIFRVLHEVEITNKTEIAEGAECTASKLYLYGCNVCLCPSTETIDRDMCTKNKCAVSDPVLSKDEDVHDDDALDEVFAECEEGKKYQIECGDCTCMKNNRLLCAKCTNVDATRMGTASHCENVDENTVFYMDCNVCYCNEKGMAICTTKKCLDFKQNQIDLPLEPKGVKSIEVVDPPISKEDCIPGTKYKADCNTCFCSLTSDGKKVLSCTVKMCKNSMRNKIASLRSDCVKNTAYEVNCLDCTCTELEGIKRETCWVDSKCNLPETNREPRSPNLDSLHGYCEPGHVYTKDCNTCRCLSDGKTVICSSRICKKVERPIIAEIIPVSQKGSKPCIKDHMYKVDCNFCFCLSNGNILCTTAKCDL